MPTNSNPPTSHVRWLVTNPATEVPKADASILADALPTDDGDGIIAAVGDCSVFPVATAAAASPEGEAASPGDPPREGVWAG